TTRRPLRSTLFPYTTLFRSDEYENVAAGELIARYQDVLVPEDVDIAAFEAVRHGIEIGAGGVIAKRERADPKADEEGADEADPLDRKSTRLNSSHDQSSYAV